jgi:hypothetical protein
MAIITIGSVLQDGAPDGGHRFGIAEQQREDEARPAAAQTAGPIVSVPGDDFFKRARGVGVDQAHEPSLEILRYVGRHARDAVKVHLVAGALRGCPSGPYAMARN